MITQQRATHQTGRHFLCRPHLLLCFWPAIIYFYATTSWAQNNNIRFERVSEGLSQVSINSCLQDQQGFLWFGTLDGLNRYDGYQFKVFRHDPDNPLSLSNNTIDVLFEDSLGFMWVGTGGGLNRFNAEHDTFERFVHDPDNPHSLSHNSISAIVEDPQGIIWIGTRGGGLNRFDHHSGIFSHFNTQNTNLHNGYVNALHLDSTGLLWVGSDDGLAQFERKGNTFKHYHHHADDPHSLSHNIVYSFLEDSQSQLWIGTQQGLNRFVRESNQFIKRIESDKINAIFEDHTEVLWVGTASQGLKRFNPARDKFTRYHYDPSNPDSLSNDTVSCILEDPSATLWVGTGGAALNKYNHSSDRFTYYQHDPANPNSLSFNWIRSIYTDQQNQLWIGTWRNGLNQWDQQQQRFIHYQHDPNDLFSLSNNDVSAIFQDQQNRFWIGTLNGGLNQLDHKKSKFKRYQHQSNDPSSLSHNTVKSIAQDSLGNLWVATNNGLNRWQPHSKHFVRYLAPFVDTELFILHIDEHDIFWVGSSDNGLIRFDPATNTSKRYQYALDGNSISNNYVKSIYQDSNGILWLGTAGGLNRFDRDSETFTVYHEKHGLPNETIYGIVADDQQQLWLSTNKGISRFDPASQQFKNFTISDGLLSSEFNHGAYARSDDGKLFFGGINGVNAFYPEHIKEDPISPIIAITDFLLFNQSQRLHREDPDSPLQTTINHTRQLILNHQQSSFTFAFSALHFIAPDKNQYAYQLVGYDQQWIKTDAANRRASYTNLNDGDYIFNIKGSNKDGVWSSPRQIKLRILPAPWRTWWAYLIYSLVISVIVGVILLLNKQKHQALVLAKANAEKASHAKSIFIANVSHEIRTPLNAVLGYTQMLARDPTVAPQHKNKITIIDKSGHHLLNLINDILDISKIEADAMTLLSDDFELVELVEGIAVMFDGRCEEKQLNWQFINQCPEVIPVHGDQGKLRQILINLLGNAVKFTRRGSITLTLSPTAIANHFRFIIKDSGIGIAPAHQSEIFKAFGQTIEGSRLGGTGLGLFIANKQVNLMGGQLQLTSTQGQGSCFSFTLPLPSALEPIELRHSKPLKAVNLASGADIHALVVDDQSHNREILTLMLQEIGIVVAEAANGQEALKHLHQAELLPALLFMDIRMPIMDGVSAVKQVHQDFKEKRPMCVAVTAHAMQPDVERYLDEGFDHYIAKPFSFEAIYQCIEQLLDINFQYQPTAQVNNGKTNQFSSLKLPPELYQALHHSATNHQISKLEAHLDQLNTLDQQGRHFAEHLNQYIKHYDMDGLLAELEKAGCE